MQALHSSAVYVLNEVRRTTQPIIDTLAPIIPTFGCGEAEVKQSLSNCIHEMEADAVSVYHENKFYMGWSPSFVDIKKSFFTRYMILHIFLELTINVI